MTCCFFMHTQTDGSRKKKKAIAILVFSVSSVLIHVSLAPDSKERKQTELQIRGAKKKHIESLRTGVETPGPTETFSDARLQTLIQGEKLIVSTAC